MPADAFIQCRVTQEMKTLVRALAEREQITESALVKQLLQVVLRTAALQGFPNLEALDRPNRDARLYVRLEPEDRQLLALRHSIAELRAVGRNLNQMAKALHQDVRATVPGRHELNAMLKVAEGLRDHFKALLRANERCWLQGYAETSD